jgi:site-specific DNA recombinase
MDFIPAVSYRRVSTQDQSDHGFSLPKQQEYNELYAKANQLDIVADFVEDISGMVPLEERPEGRKLLDFLKRHDAVALIVHEADRLSRDIVDLLGTVQKLLRAGVQVHITDVGHVQSELDIALVIKAWQGGSEHGRIKARLMRGKMGKAESGKWVGGTPPYGYRTEGARRDVHMVIYEPEAEIVRRIFQWYTVDKVPMMAICDRLNHAGIPTQRGQYWWKGIIKKLLSNATYIGVVYYAGVRIDLPALAIVSVETFEAAQQQRQLNRERAPRNRQREYLLINHLRCECGQTLSGCTNTSLRGRTYYRCSQFQWPVTRRNCPLHAPMVNGYVADHIVWTYLTQLIQDEDLLLTSVQELNAAQRATEVSGETEREALDRKVQAASRKIDRLLREFGDETDEEIARSLKGMIREAQRTRDNAREQRDKLSAERRETDRRSQAQADVLERVRGWRAIIGQADFQFKREVLDALDVRIVFKGDGQGGRALSISTVVSLPKDFPYMMERRYKKMLRLQSQPDAEKN